MSKTFEITITLPKIFTSALTKDGFYMAKDSGEIYRPEIDITGITAESVAAHALYGMHKMAYDFGQSSWKASYKATKTTPERPNPESYVDGFNKRILDRSVTVDTLEAATVDIAVADAMGAKLYTSVALAKQAAKANLRGVAVAFLSKVDGFAKLSAEKEAIAIERLLEGWKSRAAATIALKTAKDDYLDGLLDADDAGIEEEPTKPAEPAKAPKAAK